MVGTEREPPGEQREPVASAKPWIHAARRRAIKSIFGMRDASAQVNATARPARRAVQRRHRKRGELAIGELRICSGCRPACGSGEV